MHHSPTPMRRSPCVTHLRGSAIDSDENNINLLLLVPSPRSYAARLHLRRARQRQRFRPPSSEDPTAPYCLLSLLISWASFIPATSAEPSDVDVFMDHGSSSDTVSVRSVRDQHHSESYEMNSTRQCGSAIERADNGPEPRQIPDSESTGTSSSSVCVFFSVKEVYCIFRFYLPRSER